MQTCVGQATQACSQQMVNLIETLGLLLQNEAHRICPVPQFAYRENVFMILQMNGFGLGTGHALLRSSKGRNTSRDGLVKLGWVHCLQYTVTCFQYDVCGLCRCESSNHFLCICDYHKRMLLSCKSVQRLDCT